MSAPPPNSFFAYQPTLDLNRLLREYGVTWLNDMTPAAPDGNTNITWQTDNRGNVSAYVPTGGSGGGGVNPGNLASIAFYETTGSQVSGTTGLQTNTALPGIAAGQAAFSTYTMDGQSGSTLAYPDGFQTFSMGFSADYKGSGWSLGNSGGWSVQQPGQWNAQNHVRGIGQMMSGVYSKQAVGDAATLYFYNRSNAGLYSGSDEGQTTATFENFEDNSFFAGTVLSTTGTGDKNPVLSDSVTPFNTVIDGGFLVNISKKTYAGVLTSPTTTAMSFTTPSGSVQVPFLFALGVAAGDLPTTTKVGLALACNIAFANTTRDAPVSQTLTVQVAQLGDGTYAPFAIGDIVSVAGGFYPEQSIITSATTMDPTAKTQAIELPLANPNNDIVLFCGGVQGNFIEFTIDTSRSGMMSTYYAFGSLTGSDLIYGCQVRGGIGTIIPIKGISAQLTDGSADAAFNLFPGAEIVSKQNEAHTCTLETNRVEWTNGDDAYAPHYNMHGGNTLFSFTEKFSPHIDYAGIASWVQGPFATSSGACLDLRNLTGADNYFNDIHPPNAILCAGLFQSIISVGNAPMSNGWIIQVNGPPSDNPTQTGIVQCNFNSSGNMVFEQFSSTLPQGNGAYRFANIDLFEAGAYMVNGQVGVGSGLGVDPVTFMSADGKTVTVVGGIIVSVV